MCRRSAVAATRSPGWRRFPIPPWRSVTATRCCRACGPEVLFSAVRAWGAQGRGEWRGACPLHGGNNRQALSVEPRPPYLRHCMSGCGGGDALTWIALREFGGPPTGEHFAASVAIAAQLAGVHLDVGGAPPAAQRWSPPAPATSLEAHAAPAPTADDARKLALVRTLWAAADDSDDSPAMAYLRRRLAWPPVAVARHYCLPRPAAVRWMPRELLARLPSRERARSRSP